MHFIVRVKVAGFTGVGLHAHGMRIDEVSGAPHDLDLVSIQVLQDRLALLTHHQPQAEHDVMDGQPVFERVIDSIEATLAQSREVKSRFPQGF